MKMAGSMAPRTLPWHSLPSSPPVPHPGPSRDGISSPFHNHSHPFRDPQPFSPPAPSNGLRSSTLMRRRSRPLADTHIPRPMNAPSDHPSLATAGGHNPLPGMIESRQPPWRPSADDAPASAAASSLQPGEQSAEDPTPSAAASRVQPGHLSAEEITASAAASAAGSTAAPCHSSHATSCPSGRARSGPGDEDEDAEGRDAATAVHASARHMTEQRERERLLQDDACALYGER